MIRHLNFITLNKTRRKLSSPTGALFSLTGPQVAYYQNTNNTTLEILTSVSSDDTRDEVRETEIDRTTH